MEYKLKNGKSVVISVAAVDDASDIINIISTADTETKFLARNPGELDITVEQEKFFLSNIINDQYKELFVASYKGKIVVICSVGLVSKYERYRHRAEVSFVLLKDYCGMGIGGKLMIHCIKWCKDRNISQIELRVNADNKRAIEMYNSFGFRFLGTIPNAVRYPDNTYVSENIMILEI